MTSLTHFLSMAFGGRRRLGDALRRACLGDHNASVVVQLLDQGAPVSAKDPQTGRTALMTAVDNDCRAAIVALLSHGADIHMTANNGKSALDLAEEKAGQDVVDLLVDGTRANREYR